MSDFATTTRGPRRRSAAIAAPRSPEVAGPLASQPFELEGVRRRDRRQRQRAIAKELADARGDIGPASDVADHRIAGIRRFAIGGAQARKRAQSRLAGFRLAEIAGQEGGAAGEHAYCLQSCDALVDHAGVEGPPAPAGVARMT